MPDRPATVIRVPSFGEEIASSVSHGIGLLAVLAGAPFLLVRSVSAGTALDVVGASIFVACAALLYLASTLYHALPAGRAKRVFRLLDHSAIYLLIAGTYTPFTLGVLGGGWGWTLFGIVWTLAVAGVILKAAGSLRLPWLSTFLYLAMGWLVVIAIRPLWRVTPTTGLALLVAGGLCYTAGVAFYSARRLRYSHFVWHLFVLAGTACHGLAVYWTLSG